MGNGVRLKIITDSGIKWYYNRQTKDLFTNALLEPVRILRVTEDRINDIIRLSNYLIERFGYYPYLVSQVELNEKNF